MRIQHLLVDDITASGPGEATVMSVHYDFRAKQWVSPHKGITGAPIGPLTMLETEGPRFETPTVAVALLGERSLPVDSHGSISLETTWTVEAESVYAVVLPLDYVPSDDAVLTRYQSEGPPFQTASTPDSRLFFHALFLTADGFQVKLRADRDASRARREVEDADVVAGTSSFQKLRDGVEREALKPDFWMRLIELGHQVFR
jgi:hypothetical protein